MSQIIIIIVTMSILLVSGFTFLDNYIGSATASKQAEELQAVMDEVQLYKTVTKGNFAGLTIDETGLTSVAPAAGSEPDMETGALAAGEKVYEMDTVDGMVVHVVEDPANAAQALIEVGTEQGSSINPVILNKVETKFKAGNGYIVAKDNANKADGRYTLTIR